MRWREVIATIGLAAPSVARLDMHFPARHPALRRVRGSGWRAFADLRVPEGLDAFDRSGRKVVEDAGLWIDPPCLKANRPCRGRRSWSET